MVDRLPNNCDDTSGYGGRIMTFEIAALVGMGAVLLFGLAALVLAFIAGKNKGTHTAHGHHA